jgi:hypothetical protein
VKISAIGKAAKKALAESGGGARLRHRAHHVLRLRACALAAI